MSSSSATSRFRDRAADHELDVADAGGAQGFDDLAGQADVGAGQDDEADEVDVLLQRHRAITAGLLADAGVDHLEAGVAQRPAPRSSRPGRGRRARAWRRAPTRRPAHQKTAGWLVLAPDVLAARR